MSGWGSSIIIRVAAGALIVATVPTSMALGLSPPRSLGSYLNADTGKTQYMRFTCLDSTVTSYPVDVIVECTSETKWRSRPRFSLDPSNAYSTTVLVFRRGASLTTMTPTDCYGDSCTPVWTETRNLKAAWAVPRRNLAEIRLNSPDYSSWVDDDITCRWIGDVLRCGNDLIESGTQYFRIKEKGPRVSVKVIGTPAPTGAYWVQSSFSLGSEWISEAQARTRTNVNGVPMPFDPNCLAVQATLEIRQGAAVRQASVIATQGVCASPLI